jgi:ketosteroid isomerase-like protein
MSRRNVDLIMRGLEAFNRRDWDAAAAHLAEDAVWTGYLATVDGSKSLFGRQAIKEAWNEQSEALGREEFRAEAEPRDLEAGTVLVSIRLLGRGTGSGVPIEINYVQLWTFRDDLVVRVDSYGTEAEALKAAGLSE